MFKNYFCFLAIVILASCNKSDFTKEETFISVFESTATLTRQTYDDGVHGKDCRAYATLNVNNSNRLIHDGIY